MQDLCYLLHQLANKLEEKSSQNEQVPHTPEKQVDKNSSITHNIFVKENIPIEGNINSKLTTKDIYYTLCQRRDLEVSYLWQYFISFIAFSLLCFIIDIVLISKITPTAVSHIKILPFALEVIGCVCSILWIYMAKKINTHHEKYEKAISDIERQAHNNGNTSDSNNNPSEDFTLGTNIIYLVGGGSIILWIIFFIFHIFVVCC